MINKSSFARLRDAAVLMRELLQSFMFSVMSNRSWFELYNASLISFVNKGLLGFISILLALIQLYFFYYAPNKNIDGWINVTGALTGTFLTNIATYGAILSTLLNFAFAASIWLFIAGLAVGIVNQLAMLSVNLYRSYTAASGSEQRRHYQQAALYQGFIMMQLVLTIAALVFTIIIPINPILITIFCLAVVGLTVCHIAWRFGPDNARQKIKQTIGLSKVEVQVAYQLENGQKKSLQYGNLFPVSDYLSQIRVLCSDEERQEYLYLKITEKLDFLQTIRTSNIKIQSKIRVLKVLLDSLTKNAEVDDKIELLKKNPCAFQSFWLEKGDVERLYDVVVYYKNISDYNTLDAASLY
jgi:hypothetical protein